VKSAEERAETKAIRELKKKNQQLSVEIRRLRKKLRQTEREEDKDEEPNEAVEPVFVKPAPVHRQFCPKCRSESVSMLKLRGLEYYHCEECGAKGRYRQR
jgi:hypothetical protein